MRSVKIVVQQVSTGLFLKRYPVWVRLKEEARVFDDVAAAIKYCLSVDACDVRLARFSDLWELQGYLVPFHGTSLDLSTTAMVAELRKSIQANRALRQKQRELKTELDCIAGGAEGAEEATVIQAETDQ